MDHLFSRYIAEIDMFELNNSIGGFQPHFAAFVLIFRIQDFKNPLRTGQCRLDLSVKLSQFIDRAGKLFGIDNKR